MARRPAARSEGPPLGATTTASRRSRARRRLGQLFRRQAAETSTAAAERREDLENNNDLGEAQAPAGEKKRVLLLMSDTGGGHRASAQALVNALDRLYPGRLDCDVVDIWTDYGAWPYKNFVRYYQFVAKRPILWRLLWTYAKFPPTRRLQEVFANLQCNRRFEGCIAAHKPDLVVSVHPLCQQIPIKVLKKLGGGEREIPFVTVVTDLGGAHPTWFHKEADLCFVPSDNVRKIASRAGLKDEQIRQRGLPLRKGFWDAEPRTKAELREKLGFQGHRGRRPHHREEEEEEGGGGSSFSSSKAAPPPMALVVGGGDGVGGIAKVATAIARELGEEAGKKAAMGVICGKNEAARRELEAYPWPPNVEVKVVGFVSNMHEWMAAADVLVTKAGPGTIAEASTRGLPCLLSSYLPGQEAGNVKFVVQNKFGVLKRRPRRIARTIRSWFFDDTSHLRSMQSDALLAARPAATQDIAADLGRVLFGEEPQKEALHGGAGI